MSTLGVIAIVFGVLVVALAVGGAIATRRRAPSDSEFHAHLDDVNRQLAMAHAQDKGWDPAIVASAARAAFAEKHPGVEIESLTLAAVLDKPGTDQDEAVYSVRAGGDEHRLTLGRRAGEWVRVG